MCQLKLYKPDKVLCINLFAVFQVSTSTIPCVPKKHTKELIPQWISFSSYESQKPQARTQMA